jgi:fatty acid-binding protein DegV
MPIHLSYRQAQEAVVNTVSGAMNGNASGLAHELAERIRREYNPAELLINMTGPVLGLNTGPGALALYGYAQ